jgi:hypothetical protein
MSSEADPDPGALARELAAEPRLADRRDWTLLGTGGFGSVFRVDHDDLGRREAVKVLRRALDPSGVEAFRREARLMGAIGPHPYLLTVFDAGVLGSGRPYVVAEYVAGGSLQQRLADGGAIPWRDAVELCSKVAAGLQRCHDSGVLHLDIKPANILIDADDQPRLADFGVARSRLGRGVTTGAPEESALIATTVAYSPPELLEGKVSEATDVYMLAATLHALCCGHPPFPRPRNLGDHGVPAPVSSVIERALDPDPARRPSSAAELSRELATAAETPSPAALTEADGPVEYRPPVGRRSRRDRAVMLGVAGVVLLAGIIAGWMLFGEDGTTTAADRVRQVSLEPRSSSGDDPFFTDSRLAVDLPNVGTPSWFPVELAATVGGQTLQVPGTKSELYGGTGDENVCDIDALIGFLEASPEEASAFAGVLGIEPVDIPDYLPELAPVVLQTDTWVTNHGFRDGRATPRQSVLQRGTAVLVDNVGVPRVRCSCGNPLGPPAEGAENLNLANRIDDGAELSGESWPEFSPADVVTITPGPEPVAALEVVNVTTGAPDEVLVGESAAAELPSSFPLPVPLATGADAPDGVPCPPADTVVVDGQATGTASDTGPWSVTVVGYRLVGPDRWLVVLDCRVLRSSRPLVVLVEQQDGPSGRVIDSWPANWNSAEDPFHQFDADGAVRLFTWGQMTGAMADGPDTVIEVNFRARGDQILGGSVQLERLGPGGGGEPDDLDDVRRACGALEDFEPDQFPRLADQLDKDGVALQVGLDASDVPFATAYTPDGPRGFRRTDAGWVEDPVPSEAASIASARSSPSARGLPAGFVCSTRGALSADGVGD